MILTIKAYEFTTKELEMIKQDIIEGCKRWYPNREGCPSLTIKDWKED